MYFDLPYNSHTSQYFSQSRILKLEHLYEYSVGIIMYHTLNSQKYTFLKDKLIKQNSFHNFNTRSNNTYVIPRYSRNKSQFSILYVGVKILNKYERIICANNSLYKIKKLLFNSLSHDY